MINFFSSKHLSIHPVIYSTDQRRAWCQGRLSLLTTLHFGTLAQKLARPSGEEI